MHRLSVLFFIFLFFLGCGGSTESENNDKANGSGRIGDSFELDPNQFSLDQLKAIYSEKANVVYNSNVEYGVISSESIESVIDHVVDEDFDIIPDEAFRIFSDLFNEYGVTDNRLLLSKTVACSVKGTLTVGVDVDLAGKGYVAYTFDSCQFLDDEIIYGGQTLLHTVEDELTYLFLGNSTYQSTDESLVMAGYVLYDDRGVDSATSFYLAQKDLNSDVVSLLNLSERLNSIYKYSVLGTIYLGEEGRFDVDAEYSKNNFDIVPVVSSGFFNMLGEKSSVLVDILSYDTTKVSLDTNGDNEFDVGAFSGEFNELLRSGILNLPLDNIDVISIPPSVQIPNFSFDDKLTINDIQLLNVYYSDVDTPNSELEVTYSWYINDTLMVDQKQDYLPKGLAVFGDSVAVEVTVFDGYTSVTSERREIYIEATPLQLVISNMPESVFDGNVLEFDAVLYDADLKEVVGPATLLHGPKGATIDSQGRVSWLAGFGESTIFPQYNVPFYFENPATKVQELVSVNVDSFNQKNVIVRSNYNLIPKDSSQWCCDKLLTGNLSGDGQEEILQVGSSQISANSFIENEYRQTWVSPFYLGDDSDDFGDDIVSVSLVDVDVDVYKEIFVATGKYIYLLPSLESAPQKIYQTSLTEGLNYRMGTTHYIRSFAAINEDDDNVLLAMIVSPYWAINTLTDRVLEVYRYNGSLNKVFEYSLRDGSAKLAFGNVDDDLALELVTNDGFVFDTSSWQEQWNSDAFFGDDMVLVDADGNGIDEIAGRFNDGRLELYSAEFNASLSSADASSCPLKTIEADDQTGREFVVVNCSNVTTAYFWEGEYLGVEWQDEHSNFRQNETPYDSLGWIEGGVFDTKKALFMVDSSLSIGASNLAITGINTEGLFDVQHFELPFEEASYTRMFDYDSDGNYEVLAKLDGRVSIFNMDTLVEIAPIDNLPTHTFFAGVVNADDDSNLELAYASASKVKIIDLDSTDVLAEITSTELQEHQIAGLAVTEYQNSILIAVPVFYGGLSIWTYAEGSISLLLQTEDDCRVARFHQSSESGINLVCVDSGTGYSGTNIYTYGYVGSEFVRKNHIQSDLGYTKDFIFENDGVFEEAIILGFTPDTLYNRVQFVKISTDTGLIDWSSGEYNGVLSDRGMYLHFDKNTGEKSLMFSTTQGMYVFH